jgi:hypothetical protein
MNRIGRRSTRIDPGKASTAALAAPPACLALGVIAESW